MFGATLVQLVARKIVAGRKKLASRFMSTGFNPTDRPIQARMELCTDSTIRRFDGANSFARGASTASRRRPVLKRWDRLASTLAPPKAKPLAEVFSFHFSIFSSFYHCS
jgi:hypothetical protein